MTFKANVLALLLLPASLAEAQETTWDWTVAPYLWSSSVGLDLAVTDGPSIGGGAEFKDLLDKVDTVFMGRLEARKGAWGMYLDSIDIQTGPSETDVMLGARAIGRLAQRWHWALRGDLSFGGSEGAYNGLASFGYTFGESDLFTMTLGYRYMSIKMDGMTQRNNRSSADISLSGPVLGFIFKF